MADSHESRVGTQFGPYHLRRLVGRGGMGQVFEAYDTVKDRTVALKLLPEEFAEDEVYRERFRRESHAAARLQEPHVIPIHDFGEIDGHLYLDMRSGEGQQPAPPAQQVRADAAGAGGRDRASDRRRARRRPRRRTRPPRRQAREHHRHPRRFRLPGRLRPRQQRHRRAVDHAGHRGRHVRLHGAGAVRQG